jgi:hypothetical protein
MAKREWNYFENICALVYMAHWRQKRNMGIAETETKKFKKLNMNFSGYLDVFSIHKFLKFRKHIVFLTNFRKLTVFSTMAEKHHRNSKLSNVIFR